MPVDFVASSDGTKLPTRTRTDGAPASGTVEVPEGVTDFLDGSGNPVPVSAAAPMPITTGTGVTLPVSAASMPLPSGASTEATLSALNAKITAVNTGAVTVSSSALPTGAATETTLAALNAKATAINTGAVVLAAGTAVAGRFGIDQTTPGTTNLVQVGGSLPAGTNAIGTVTARLADTSGNGITSGSLNAGVVRGIDVIVRDSTGAQVSSFGGSSVNLTQINGTAISNANPLPVYVGSSTSVTGTLTTVGNTVVGPTDRGYMGYVVDVSTDVSGSGITVVFEMSPDNGTTWRSFTCTSAVGSNYSTATETMGASANRTLMAGTCGFQFRARLSARVAGTTTVIIAGVMSPVLQANIPIAGTVNISTGNGLPLAPASFSSGGLTVFGTGSGGSAATTNATSVKASGGRLYTVQVANTSASVKFVKFYNKASAPTVGTDTPVARYAVPAGWSGDLLDTPLGRAFSTGIAFAITGGGADSDTTAVAAGDVYLVGDIA